MQRNKSHRKEFFKKLAASRPQTAEEKEKARLQKQREYEQQYKDLDKQYRNRIFAERCKEWNEQLELENEYRDPEINDIERDREIQEFKFERDHSKGVYALGLKGIHVTEHAMQRMKERNINAMALANNPNSKTAKYATKEVLTYVCVNGKRVPQVEDRPVMTTTYNRCK